MQVGQQREKYNENTEAGKKNQSKYRKIKTMQIQANKYIANTKQMQKNKYNANTEKQTKRTPQRDLPRGTGLRQILFQPSSPREVASLTSTKANQVQVQEVPSLTSTHADQVQVQVQSTTGGGESNKYKRRSEQIRIKEFQLTSTNDQLRHFSGKTFCKVADMTSIS